MNCKQANRRLAEYVFDELDAETRAQVDAHLDSCEACRAAVADMRAAAALLGKGLAAVPAPELSAARRDALLAGPEPRAAGVPAAAAKPSGGSLRFPAWRVVGLAASMALLLAGLVGLLLPALTGSRARQRTNGTREGKQVGLALRQDRAEVEKAAPQLERAAELREERARTLVVNDYAAAARSVRAPEQDMRAAGAGVPADESLSAAAAQAAVKRQESVAAAGAAPVPTPARAPAGVRLEGGRPVATRQFNGLGAAEMQRKVTSAEAVDDLRRQPRARRGSGSAGKAEAESNIRAKLSGIVIPRLVFHGASVHDVLHVLRLRSKELDPQGEGVTILTPGAFGAGAEPPPMRATAAPAATPVSERTITMEVENIPLIEAIRYVCLGAGLQYRIEKHAVLIADKNVPLEATVARTSREQVAALPGELGDSAAAETKNTGAPMVPPATGLRPVVMKGQARSSTFAVEPGPASYMQARNCILHRRQLPPPDSVRVEQFVNAVTQDYPTQSRSVLSLHAEAMESPFQQGLILLRIDVRGRIPADIARDARIRVEFNPQRVRRYRLFGYEEREIAARARHSFTAKGGGIGSGQGFTALCEVELVGAAPGPAPADIGMAYLDYRAGDTNRIEEMSSRLSNGVIRALTPKSGPHFFVVACAAEFAEILRGRGDARRTALADVRRVLEPAVMMLPLESRARELLSMVQTAQGLDRG